MMIDDQQVLIVEGTSDKAAIEPLLAEPVNIVCTHGTVAYEQLLQLGDDLDDADVYILVDADASGDKLRNQLKQVLPGARHLYTKRVYREVAVTPREELARILHKAHFELSEPWCDIVRLPEPLRRRPPKKHK